MRKYEEFLTPNPPKKYKAGMYLRLSNEDRNKKHEYDNSESIENQERICRGWLAVHPEVELYDIYIDDGYTGMNYNRGEYQRLSRDIDAGHVNLILAKNLIRFGREQVETLILFKREFVLKGIRFVGVVDNIDYEGPETDDGLSLSVKIMMNDHYSHTTSVDVRSALQVKRKAGLFVGSFACYGYVKDPENKNHLLVDEYAAQVVKQIFSMFIYGNNIKWIAQNLNEQNILCPSEYKKQVQNLKYECPIRLDTTNYWTYATVKNILKNQVYIGSVVQHRKEKVAYNLEKIRNLPKEQWTVVPNMHEPIISQEDFEKAQQLMRVRTREVSFKNLSPYAGVIFCGDCGRAMSKQQFEGKKGFRYRCGTYAKIGKDYCTQHAIYTGQLDILLLGEINRILKSISMDDSARIRENAIVKERHLANDNLSLLKKRLQALDEEKKEMLRLLSKKVVAESDYLLYNEGYEREQAQLELQIQAAEANLDKVSERIEEYERFVENFLKFRKIKEVNREVVINLVDKITIFENQRVQIKFLFKNPFED